MLRDVRHKAVSNRTISGFTPDSHWSPFSQGPRVFPRLRDTVATFLFSGRSGSEFQYISQRHTQTYTCRTIAWPATQAVIDKVL